MEKENKPLSEKVGNITCNEDFSDSGWNMGDEIFWASDVKQAVKEAYDELDQCFPKNSSHHSGWILCDIKRIFKDKFGFELE